MANLSFPRLILLVHRRLLTTATAASISPQSTVTVEFLTKSCGLPLESALSVCQKLEAGRKTPGNHETVVELLKSHEFENAQVAKLVSKLPSILRSRLRNNLKPKFEFLMERGFVGRLLPELLIANPKILKSSLDSQLKPSLDFLKELLLSDDRVVSAVRRAPWLLTFDYSGILQRNIDCLRREGLSIDSISKFLCWNPRALMQKVERFAFAVKKVKELGLDPNSTTFLHAVRVILSMSDSTWNKKVEVLKSLGWSEEGILLAFKRGPSCLACSEEKMRSAMDFIVNKLKLTPETVVTYPKFLVYGIDRLRRRYNVLEVLRSRKLIKDNKKVARFFVTSEPEFLEQHVLKFSNEVPGLLEIYGGNLENRRR